MKKLARLAILCKLTAELRHKGSWCGETHLQKVTYFLQELLKVPLGFEFVLYKFGPFSFDLRDELVEMRAYGLVELEPQPYPFGPKLCPTTLGDELTARFPKTSDRYAKKIEYITNRLNGKGVVDLEQLATALYVRMKNKQDMGLEDLMAEFAWLKPHISNEAARTAIKEVDIMMEEAGQLVHDEE